ncbi:MAG: hypothetical protein V1838_03290 [Patescibacteria group bacterium]
MISQRGIASLIAVGVIMSLSVFVLATVILNQQSTDRLAAELAAVRAQVSNVNSNDNSLVTNFEECAAAGNPVMESYPRQCAAGGRTYTENISDADQLLGGDEDEHGCKPSAGYSWCEIKQKCLRTWEEDCTEASNTNATIDETANWQTFDSHTNNDITNNTFENWGSFLSNDEAPINFTIKYPLDWTLDWSVFYDENNEKIAEFSPGTLTIPAGRTCFDQSFGDEYYNMHKEISRDNVTIGDYSGVKIISEVGVEGNPSLTYWYPHQYCLQKGNKVLLMTFYERILGTANVELFDQILSTFQFTD